MERHRLADGARIGSVRILYLSPGFPPNSHRFCVAAHARGASVLAVGDMPEVELPPEARHALERYVCEPRMGDYETLLGIARSMIAEHGRIDFVESNGEHWLEVEGRLRDDLGIEGLTARDVARLRSKLAMAEAFRSGNLGVMDYYKMRNVQADTEMRDSIANPGGSSGSIKPGREEGRQS